MSRTATGSAAAEMLQRRNIRGTDIHKIQSVLGGGTPGTPEDAGLLFSLDSACPVQDPAWREFFVAALARYVVLRAEPQGYLTAAKARWLKNRLAKDGIVKGRSGIELLLTVLEAARWSPPSFSRFALSQVEYAVRTGKGPLRAGLRLAPGAITTADVRIVRHILCSFAGRMPLPLTAAELEGLFAIDIAAGAREPAAAWTKLLIEAAANAILAASGCALPPRNEALQPVSVLSPAGGAVPPVTAAAKGGKANWRGEKACAIPGPLLPGYRPATAEERELALLEGKRLAIVTGEEFCAPSAAWIAARLTRGPRIPRAPALVAWLKETRHTLDPVLLDIAVHKGQAA